MATINAEYYRFNGTIWDIYYFKTTIGQVVGLDNDLDSKVKHEDRIKVYRTTGGTGAETDMVMILCPLTASQNVLGTLYLERTSGHKGGTQIDIIYSSGTTAGNTEQNIKVLQNGWNMGDFSLVIKNIGGIDYACLRRTGVAYFITTGWFVGYTTHTSNFGIWYETPTGGSTLPLTGDMQVLGHKVVLNNDSRLTNSRPSSDDVITVSEATTGTETTKRLVNALNLKAIIEGISPPGSRPASDVYSWAKASNKPSYAFSEIGSKPNTLGGYGITDAYDMQDMDIALASKEDAFSKNDAFNKNFGSGAGTVCEGNDARLSNARPASDVYSWAKASVKPSYNASEVGASPEYAGVTYLTGTSYTLSNDENNKVFFYTSTSTVTISIPPMPAGTQITLVKLGASGTIRVIRSGSGSINGSTTYVTATTKQYGAVTLISRASGVWIMVGVE